jgi:hypothetical protein
MVQASNQELCLTSVWDLCFSSENLVSHTSGCHYMLCVASWEVTTYGMNASVQTELVILTLEMHLIPTTFLGRSL